jgi:hypothetical protein
MLAGQRFVVDDVTRVACGWQFLALVDQSETDDELVRGVVDWLADLHAEADARRMVKVLIEKAQQMQA